MIDESLSDWAFHLSELSNGVYRAEGKDISGHEVACTASDPDEALAKCKSYAADLIQQNAYIRN